jgi:hypothetical protein
MMVNMYKKYFGTIEEVYPPDHAKNISKTQHEYKCIITGDDYSQLPVICMRVDAFGGLDNYEDVILSKNDKVFVQFPRGDISLGFIQGGPRAYTKPQSPAMGKYLLQRFNKIETKIDKDNTWSVTSDSGPIASIGPSMIVLDDSKGQRIVFDKTNKIITIDSNEIKIEVVGNVTANINGNLTTSVAKDAKVTVKGEADIKVTKKAKIKAKDVEVEAENIAKVKAKMIQFNGQEGDILTTATDPVIDLIFGVPTIGVPTVKAGAGG